MERHLVFDKKKIKDIYLFMFYPDGVPTVSGEIELFDKNFFTTFKSVASVKTENIRNAIINYGDKRKYPKYLGGTK